MSAAKQPKCPVCKKPQVDSFKPFCSAGCKDRDLLQWLGEGYKVPGPPASSDQIMPQLGGENGDENST